MRPTTKGDNRHEKLACYTLVLVIVAGRLRLLEGLITRRAARCADLHSAIHACTREGVTPSHLGALRGDSLRAVGALGVGLPNAADEEHNHWHEHGGHRIRADRLARTDEHTPDEWKCQEGYKRRLAPSSVRSPTEKVGIGLSKRGRRGGRPIRRRFGGHPGIVGMPLDDATRVLA